MILADAVWKQWWFWVFGPGELLLGLIYVVIAGSVAILGQGAKALTRSGRKTSEDEAALLAENRKARRNDG